MESSLLTVQDELAHLDMHEHWKEWSQVVAIIPLISWSNLSEPFVYISKKFLVRTGGPVQAERKWSLRTSNKQSYAYTLKSFIKTFTWH